MIRMNNASRIVLGCLYLCFGVALSSRSNFTFSHILLRLSRQANTKRCRLPEHPNFGQWTIYEQTARQVPGNSVPSATILEFSCQDGYKLDGEDISTCIRGQWKPKISQCLQTCPTITNTSFMTATCTFNEKPVEKCADAIEGSIARFSCAAYYEDLGLEANPYRLCSKGSWGKIPECVPVCGKKSSDPRLLVGAFNTERGEYPWQVALYTAADKSLICGGTLLNERIIVTAAHCVTNPNGALLPKDTYIVAAGKYFRKYDHPGDLNKAQFSPISEIFIPRQYKGELQNYFGDIAVLVTEKTFVLSESIQPICVDWGFRRSQILLNSVQTPHCFVTGWGYTVEYKNPSNILKVLEVPFVDETECERKIPPHNKHLLTDDKICAGFLNSSASACKGDSGGGLVYKFGDRYYLLAIASVSPPVRTQEGGCNSQQYTLYTNVSYYTERFILDKETRFRASAFGDLRCNYDPNCGIPRPATPIPEVTTNPSTSLKANCTAPSYPGRGKWSVVGKESNNLLPGDSVGPGTALMIHCDERRILTGSKITVCFNGTWTPYGRCSKINYCPPIPFIPNMKVTCVDIYLESENCFYASDGSLAKFECAPYYENLELIRRPTHVCQNGTWDQPTPSCTPVCGRTNAEDPENYPWQVDIHVHNIEEGCSGTLITEKLVLTSAMCIWDGIRTFLPKENFTVAAGTSSKKNRTQYSGLQDIIIPEEFHPDVFNSPGNIAILVLEKPFELSANLQPICIDLASNVETPKQGYGYIPMRIPMHNDPNVVVAKILKASTFNAPECFNKLPDEAKFTVNSDKYYDIIPHTGPLISERGRGLWKKCDAKFYILGIASFFTVYSPRGDSRGTQTVWTITPISKHLNNFIVPQVAKYTR